MATLLVDWLNSLELKGVPKITEVQESCASGYVIGRALVKLGFVADDENAPAPFVNSGTAQSKVTNFSALNAPLKEVGINLSPAAAKAIMVEERGAAAKLLFALKQKVEADAGTMHPKYSSGAHGELHCRCTECIFIWIVDRGDHLKLGAE